MRAKKGPTARVRPCVGGACLVFHVAIFKIIRGFAKCLLQLCYFIFTFLWHNKATNFSTTITVLTGIILATEPPTSFADRTKDSHFLFPFPVLHFYRLMYADFFVHC